MPNEPKGHGIHSVTIRVITFIDGNGREVPTCAPGLWPRSDYGVDVLGVTFGTSAGPAIGHPPAAGSVDPLAVRDCAIPMPVSADAAIWNGGIAII